MPLKYFVALTLKKSLLFILLALSSYAFPQQWGLYTLYSNSASINTYLVDTNGTVYKTWTFPTDRKTCFSSYLIPGDTLVRTVINDSNVIYGGGVSGIVQKVDWDNNVIWDFKYSDLTTVLHHDICPMPNGNILMIACEKKTVAEAQQAGSNPSITRRSEKIIEVHPTGPNTGDIVWEWKAWDHLCQRHDSTKDNYVPLVKNNPQLIHINYRLIQDFIHLNGIDYNAALDQIVVSSYVFSEIWVIDHSTTSAEAAGHTGGNSGHGGDLIYRWGNPQAYGLTDTAIFKVAHDAHWIPPDNPYFPNYLCAFNNLGGADSCSSTDIFHPPYNGYNYDMTPGQACGPATYAWRYTDRQTAATEGSSQQLPNGNTLVCLSGRDTIREVDISGNVLWNLKTNGNAAMAFRYSKCYVRGPAASAGASSTSVSSGAPVTLYSSATSATETNPAFIFSWSSLPAGFSSTDQNPVLNPASTATYIVTVTDTTTGCSDTASVTITVDTTTTNANSFELQNDLVVYPNPTTGTINISGNFLKDKNYEIIVRNVLGETIMTGSNSPAIDFSAFSRGIYFLIIKFEDSEKNYKIIY